MKFHIIFLFCGITIFSQKNTDYFELQKLINSNFKTMEVITFNKGAKSIKAKYEYSSKSNSISVNYFNKNEENLDNAVYYFNSNNTINEVTENYSKSNISKEYQTSIKYFYGTLYFQKNTYNSLGKLLSFSTTILDDYKRVIETANYYNLDNKFLVSDISKYKWLSNSEYLYERTQYDYPVLRFFTRYKLNKNGDCTKMSEITAQNYDKETNSWKNDIVSKQENQRFYRKYDSKQNLVKTFIYVNKKKVLIEERKIEYN